LFVNADATPEIEENLYKTWFYFSVQGIQRNEIVTFTLKNPSKYQKMCQAGFRPLYAVRKITETRAHDTYRMKWKRLETPI